MKKSQHSCKIIRRFQEDIWGRFPLNVKSINVLKHLYQAHQDNFSYKKLLKKRMWFLGKKVSIHQKNKVLKKFLRKNKERFTYKVVTEEQEVKRLKHSLKAKFYFSMLKLRRFYGNLKKRNFKRIFKNEKGLNDKFLVASFGYFLESRLDVILYRANFFNSIYSARQYVNHGKIFVNGRLESKPGLKVNIFDIISISNCRNFYNIISKRVQNNKLFFNYPIYLYVNYKLGLISIWRLPLIREIPYPFFMDLGKVTNSFLR